MELGFSLSRIRGLREIDTEALHLAVQLELEFSLSRIGELREKLLKAAPCGARNARKGKIVDFSSQIPQ